MRTQALCVILVGAVALAGCSAETPTVSLPVYEHGPDFGVVANHGRHAAVPLSGQEEVPVRETRARGTATFQLSADRESISYRLTVANIENVVAAHIHVGAAGTNGPVVVWLYGPVNPGGGRVNGVIGDGTFTAADFRGPLAGMTMADLLDEMASGNAYVNVHTNDGVAPTNTGPGDFPGGEVRGQIR